jgi:hypothetical protein
MIPIPPDKIVSQNWLITPAALAVGEQPPAKINDQKWLLILSGVVIADLKGNSAAQWLHETLFFLPDIDAPLNWAINNFSIPNPGGAARFSLVEWAPFVSLNAIFNEQESINSGFAVDGWRPAPFDSETDVSNQLVTQLFTGIHVDVAVRDIDAWIYRISYNITLLGKIVFFAGPV